MRDATRSGRSPRAQLEAFHQTFNFCMDCRQYTCTDCWNQAEGRCLTCAPMPGQVEADAAAAAAHAAEHAAAPQLGGMNGADAGMAWPTVDLTAEEATSAAVTMDAASGRARHAVHADRPATGRAARRRESRR